MAVPGLPHQLGRGELMALLVHSGISAGELADQGQGRYLGADDFTFYSSTSEPHLTATTNETMRIDPRNRGVWVASLLNPVWHCRYCGHLNTAGEGECPTCGGPR